MKNLKSLIFTKALKYFSKYKRSPRLKDDENVMPIIENIQVFQDGSVFSVYTDSCTLLFDTLREPPRNEKYCMRLDVFMQKYYGSDREELFVIASRIKTLLYQNNFCSDRCTLTDLFDMTDDIYFIVHIVNTASRLLSNQSTMNILGFGLWKVDDIVYLDTGDAIVEIVI